MASAGGLTPAVVIVAVGATLAMWGCAGDVVSPDTLVPSDALQLPQHQVEDLLYESSSGVFWRHRAVILDMETWGVFWDYIYAGSYPKRDPFPIDFSESMVVAASMGSQSTGGHSIEITGVYWAEGRLYTVVRETTPGSSCLVTTGVTAPVTAVRVPRMGGEAVFVEEELVHEC